MKEEDKNYLIAGCKDNTLYIIDYNTGDIKYSFQTHGWIETFFIKDINKDGKLDILIGSNDNNIYRLLQKKEAIILPENNTTTVDKPEAEQLNNGNKNVPFEEVGILGGTLLGSVYLLMRKRK